MIDTGAAVNVIEEDDFEKIKNKVKLKATQTKIYPYKSSEPLQTLGRFQANIRYEFQTDKDCQSVSKAEFHVVKHNGEIGGSLVSFQTAEDLGLIRIIKQVKGQKLMN